ncbi:MAG: tetratricopeptide repeat protein [Proteobacteria bacterium]|nr:tetratricopeptide repeat protein [Pseudomonadota bacterium]
MRTLYLIIALVWLKPSPARAEFAAGLQAYDGGDYTLALAEWRAAADAGDPDAQIALAELFIQGLGVARNPSMAVHWYRRAAHQGALIAQLNLGDLYARGPGVERDLVRAYAWLQMAARRGQKWALRRRDEIGRRLTAEQIAAALALTNAPHSMY